MSKTTKRAKMPETLKGVVSVGWMVLSAEDMLEYLCRQREREADAALATMTEAEREEVRVWVAGVSTTNCGASEYHSAILVASRMSQVPPAPSEESDPR